MKSHISSGLNEMREQTLGLAGKRIFLADRRNKKTGDKNMLGVPQKPLGGLFMLLRHVYDLKTAG